MNVAARCALVAWALVVCNSAAKAQVVLDFVGLQDDEFVQNFYNGGLGSEGSGPGPNYGITLCR